MTRASRLPGRLQRRPAGPTARFTGTLEPVGPARVVEALADRSVVKTFSVE